MKPWRAVAAVILTVVTVAAIAYDGVAFGVQL